jgi:hypothetical protein
MTCDLCAVTVLRYIAVRCYPQAAGGDIQRRERVKAIRPGIEWDVLLILFVPRLAHCALLHCRSAARFVYTADWVCLPSWARCLVPVDETIYTQNFESVPCRRWRALYLLDAMESRNAKQVRALPI